MTNLVAVKYVGKKPTAHDNVAGSGKVWNGNGDVQHVTPLQADKLTKYADQWALAPVAAADTKKKSDDTSGNQAGGGGNGPGAGTGGSPAADDDTLGLSPEEVAEILKTPLEKLTKPKLIAFAKIKLRKDLNPALGKTAMVDQIEEWMRTAE